MCLLSQWPAGFYAFWGVLVILMLESLFLVFYFFFWSSVLCWMGQNQKILHYFAFGFAPWTVPCCKLKSHIPECKPIMFPMEISGIFVATFKMRKSIYFFFLLVFLPSFWRWLRSSASRPSWNAPLARAFISLSLWAAVPWWLLELSCSCSVWTFTQEYPRSTGILL